MDNPLPRHAANPTQQNIDAIAKLEHEALGRRTITERVGDVITKTCRRDVNPPGLAHSDLRLELGKSTDDPRTQSI